MMNVGIVGSRGFNNYDEFCNYMSRIPIDPKAIISGGAKGADTLAEQYAKENDLDLIVFKPDWEKYGKSAGFKRNRTIVNHSDLIIAFWDIKSSGTKNTIDTALELGKPVIIFPV